MINYVYKTINMVNGRYYVGVKTNSRHIDDGYFGSGQLLARTIEKYGLENFRKEILWHFSTPEECFEKQKKIPHIERNGIMMELKVTCLKKMTSVSWIFL